MLKGKKMGSLNTLASAHAAVWAKMAKINSAK
jgi:hypothetical protein